MHAKVQVLYAVMPQQVLNPPGYCLTGVHSMPSAGQHLSRAAFGNIAMLGPTLRHLILLDVRMSCGSAVEQTIRSLPHLQVGVCSDGNSPAVMIDSLSSHAVDIAGLGC